MTKLPIAVVVLTLNEEHYLPGLLENIQPWVEQVFVVDSLSMDRTVPIALAHGVTVVQRPFTNFGDQWNWALQNLPIETAWTMKLDPDERLPRSFRDELATLLETEPGCGGYRFRRRLWFMGKPLHQTQWVTRLWRTGQCRFSDVLVNEHPIITGRVEPLRSVMEHLDSPTLHHWFEKQNMYSTMRAIEMVQGGAYAVAPRLFSRDALHRRMFLKRLFFRLPFRHGLMWWYLLLFRRALFDGQVGRFWASLRVQVYRWAEYKANEMRRTGNMPVVLQPRSGAWDPRVADTPLQRRLLNGDAGRVSAAPASPRPGTDRPPRPADRRLRVAINAVSLAPGGGMVVLLGYLQGWRDLDMPVDLVVYASRSTVRQRLAEQYPEIEIVPFAADLPPIRHFFLQQFTLGNEIARRGADVVFTTNAMLKQCETPQLVLHQNLKRFITPSIARQLRLGGLGEAVRDLAAREALRRAPINVFISRFLKEEAERIVPASLPRNYVVHNGVPDQLIEQAQRLDDEPPVPGQLIAVQSPAEHKDTPTLFRTLATLLQRRPDVPWRLKLVGGGNWSAFHPLARELGIASRIDYLGYLDHDALGPLLQQALCLVFTSRLEGFGLPPLEAMARRCPSISCNTTALPEIVGDAGVLVPPGDPAAFARAVIELHDNPTLRQRYIDRGVQHIAHFNWTTSAERMTGLLERACSQPTWQQPASVPQAEPAAPSTARESSSSALR